MPQDGRVEKRRLRWYGRAFDAGTSPTAIHFAYATRLPNGADLVSETGDHMQIIVRDNNVDQALRALKKKLQREGVYREMKLRRHYEKPSEKRARERAAAVRRARKLERKRMERDGAR